MTGPLARIVLRYGVGALVTYGLMSSGTAFKIINDPDIALVIGGVLGIATEGFYWLAKRKGWAT